MEPLNNQNQPQEPAQQTTNTSIPNKQPQAVAPNLTPHNPQSTPGAHKPITPNQLHTSAKQHVLFVVGIVVVLFAVIIIFALLSFTHKST